jgi:hypothetical protein
VSSLVGLDRLGIIWNGERNGGWGPPARDGCIVEFVSTAQFSPERTSDKEILRRFTPFAASGFLHRHILFSKEEKKRKDEENPKWSRFKTTLYDKKVFFVSFIYEIWSMKKIGLLLYVKIMIVFFCV